MREAPEIANRLQHLTIQRLTRKVLRGFSSNKKGASQVVSTVVLTAGVLAMSIAVLYWTYSMGKIGNIEYEKSTTTSSNAVAERIGFEYVTYSNGEVTASIINWGKADNITIAHVIIVDSNFNYVGSNTGGNVVLRNVDDGTALTDNVLHIGSDATFTTRITGQISSSDLYYLRIVTSRGRNFDFAFTP